MISTEYNEKAFLDSIREQSREEGREEGREESKLDMIKSFLRAETPVNFITAATGWSKEKVLQFAEKEGIAVY